MATKHEQIKKSWIKINAAQLQHITHFSGLNIKAVRVGNRYNSTRKYSIVDRFKSCHYWTVVVYSYSSVKNEFNRTLTNEPDIYLNPEFKYLIEE